MIASAWRPRWPWPRGLGGRAILVLLAAVILVHLGTVALYHEDAEVTSNAILAGQLAGRLSTAARAMADRPPQGREATAHALSSPGLDLHWGNEAAADPDAGVPGTSPLRQRLLGLAPELDGRDLRLERDPGPGRILLGSLRLVDGTYLNFSTAPAQVSQQPPHATLVSTTLMAAGVIAVAALLLRTLTRPLRLLAQAADRIGHGPEVAVPEQGPEEVRHVAQAFNAMQGRIHRLIHDRTQALAAVSHDLRTPITRLRLRAGFVADAEAQAAIDADLDEMEAMIEATLEFLRGQDAGEAPRVTDVAALLSSLVDDAADAGRPASYHGPESLLLELRRLPVKRAFANLIENALAYGGTVRVSLGRVPGAVRVRVDDDGPGIPDASLEQVFEPFQRFEASRNRGTGGVGLGLAIVRQAIEREGGAVCLLNRPEGGLRAEVTLPDPRPAI